MADPNKGIIDEIVGYLKGRNMMPPINFNQSLGSGVHGKFEYGGDLPPAGELSLAPGAGEGTLGHELTHAAERQILKQFYEQQEPKHVTMGSMLTQPTRFSTPERSQFQQGYDKLRFRGAALDSLKRIGTPEWWAENADYRATTTEVPAWGVGFAVDPGSANAGRAPNHVNATAATEFAILLDLAMRQLASQPTKTAKK